MNNYPNGVKPSDFDAQVFEYKEIEVTIDDVEIDTGLGLQSGYLHAQVEQLPNGELVIESAYYELIGNNGEPLGQAPWIEGVNLQHDEAIYQQAARKLSN